MFIIKKIIDKELYFGIINTVPVYNIFLVLETLRGKLYEKRSMVGMQKNSTANREINNLVLAVKNNDTASFIKLLGHFSRTITMLSNSFSLPVSEHEDLCQEGRMALYRAAMSYDEEGASFSTYAITCMTNAMISFAKKYNAQNAGKAYDVSPDEVGQEATGTVSALELEELLSDDGFAGLSSYERRVMAMKISGYKVREIAKKLGKQTKSVENTLFRARQKLKKHIDG